MQGVLRKYKKNVRKPSAAGRYTAACSLDVCLGTMLSDKHSGKKIHGNYLINTVK